MDEFRIELTAATLTFAIIRNTLTVLLMFAVVMMLIVDKYGLIVLEPHDSHASLMTTMITRRGG